MLSVSQKTFNSLLKGDRKKMKNLILGIMLVMGSTDCLFADTVGPVYDVGTSVESRSISFENITGDKGAGGKAASPLGVGRKGSAARHISPGETIVLCDIDGPGVIRHIWMTLLKEPAVLQGLILRVYWDNQAHCSIETPIGPFFGVMHGQVKAYQSAVHSVNALAGLNSWMEMPFKKHVKIEIVNESSKETPYLLSTPLYYSIDYTIGDTLPRETGYLHAIYRRENPTTLKKDFEILPRREGKGRYLGCVLGIRTLSPHWWGEGEFKVYLDGDREFPTICGTGTEDFVGQSWGLQDATFLYAGTSLRTLENIEQGNLNTIYRWHIKDPIYWKKDIRVTIQQLGYADGVGLYDRQDDCSVCSFWYEPVPSKPLPPMPDFNARAKDYDVPEKKNADK